MYANPPESEIQGTIFKFRKRNKSSSLLVYVLYKHEIRHFHVVVVKKQQRNVQKSVMHVQLFCLLNLLFFLDVLTFRRVVES